MALEDILAAIRRDAEEEIARIQSDAATAEAALLAEAAAQAQVSEAQAAAARHDEIAAAERGLRGQATAQVLREMGQAREDLFQEILAAVRRRLAALRQDPRSFHAITGALLREAMEALPEARVLRADPRDRELIDGLLLAAGRQLEVQPIIESWGGVELETGDGRRLYNTLEERLARADDDLRVLAAGTLPAMSAEGEPALA